MLRQLLVATSSVFTVAQNNYDLALLTLSQLLQVPYKGFQVESLLIANPSEELIYSECRNGA